MGVSSRIVESVVSSCAERTNMEGLREAVNGVYEGMTGGCMRGPSLRNMIVAGTSLSRCLNGGECERRLTNAGPRINVMAKLT